MQRGQSATLASVGSAYSDTLCHDSMSNVKRLKPIYHDVVVISSCRRVDLIPVSFEKQRKHVLHTWHTCHATRF